MNSKVSIGKKEYFIIAIINLFFSILISYVTYFIVPILYFFMFWALYRGHKQVQVVLVVANLLIALCYSSITIYHQPFLMYIINLIIPIILIILTILFFVGKQNHFLNSKSLIRQKLNAEIFDDEENET